MAEKEKKYDVVILGGGAAGLSAGIYAVRYGLSCCIVSKEIGGMANWAHKVENYPGIITDGADLMQKFYAKAKSLGVDFIIDEIGKIEKNPHGLEIILKNKQTILGKSLIIALGTEKRKLEIPGEKEFLGKGVSYCATCDAFFFKNKEVAVIGGGDSASKAALALVGIAKKVYVIYRGEALRCQEIDKRKLEASTSILCSAIPVLIKGNKKVEGLIINENGKERELKVDGVFIEVGVFPKSELARQVGLKIDESGYIVVNDAMETTVPRVFAAGDIVKSKLKQIIVASSQGAIAAKSAFDFVSTK